MSVPLTPTARGKLSVTERPRKVRTSFILLLVTFCLYSSLFIYRTSYLIDGQRVFSLFDDEMISMQYARNFAHGDGLVWFPGGEKVEGYSNPLWVFYMSIFHLFPLSPLKISLFLQISGVCFLLLTLILVRKISLLLSGGDEQVALVAVALTAFYSSLVAWSLQGTEVSILALLSTFVVFRVLRFFESGHFPFWLYFLLGGATLIRLDAVVLFATITAFLYVTDSSRRKEHLKYAAISFLVFIGGQTAFRFYYYGDWLPNTYYLKMTGFPAVFRISRGIFVFLWFVWHMNWAVFLLAFVTLIFRKNREVLLLLCVFAAQVAYSIYIGGDAWEGSRGCNRFISSAIPLFFILLSLGLLQVCRMLFVESDLRPALARMGTVLLSLMTLISLNAYNGSSSILQWILVKRLNSVEENIDTSQIALSIQRLTTPEARIGVVRAGVAPYFSGRPAVDFLGKNDKHIAHLPMRYLPSHQRLEEQNIHLPLWVFRLISFFPGHQKWDYGYSIGEQRPDAVLELWRSPQEAEVYLNHDYVQADVKGYPVYFRKKSPYILWNKIDYQ